MDQDLYQQAIARAAAGELAEAIAVFDQVLQLHPDFAPAYYQRGLTRFKLNQFQAAIADYTRALMTDSSNGNLYYARALAHLSAGSLDSAVADAKDAIRLKPSYAAAYHLLGTIRHKQQFLEKALTGYKKAAELYLDQQDVPNARRCLELIRQIRPVPPSNQSPSQPILPPPVSPEDFLQRAMQKAKTNGYSNAIEDLNWAIQIDPQDVQAYVCRAQIRATFEDIWGAIEDYRRAAKLYLDRADKVKAQHLLDQIEHLRSNRTTRSYSLRESPRSPRYTPVGRVSSAVQRRLLRLVGDDRKIASGLVERLRQRYPGMPEDWYWEKAIYDLERDRR